MTVLSFRRCGLCGDGAELYPVRIIMPDATLADRWMCFSCLAAVSVTVAAHQHDLDTDAWRIAEDLIRTEP